MTTNIEDLRNPEKMTFLCEIENDLGGLELQRSRVYENRHAVHDAGYYMILLRRLYRKIEDAAKRSSHVANFKGKFIKLFLKIKIRDDFEHGVKKDSLIDKKILIDYGIVSENSSGDIRIQTSVLRRDDSICIVSDDKYWDLGNDHQSFCKIIEEFIGLYPYYSFK